MLAWFVLVPSFAQEESISKQINQIKRDTTFLYSEATAEKEEDAFDAARGLLMIQVQEYLETNQKATTVNEDIRKSTYSKTSSLVMTRGSLYRVFVYVKKGDINAICGNHQRQLAVVAEPPVSTSTERTANGAAKVTDNKVVEKEQKAQPVSEPAMERVQAAATPAPSTAKVDAQDTDRKTVTDPGLPAWQMNAIDELLQCRDVNEVKAKFNRMKAEYKIKRYGTPDTCPGPDSAFWLIFSQDGSVNTILGPGTKERISFRDMKMSELDKYKGMNALWFNFAK